jgi:UDP-N-acetylmuramate--alanine ligase
MEEYYFIGIKGTGMSSLACMLHDIGYKVSGSDLEKHFFTEEGLRSRNIPIYPFNPDNIHDNMHIIIGNAFLDDFPEVQAAHANKTCVCARYHEFLGTFLKKYHLISIAGSHGKTTTTGMLASVMQEFDNTGWLIGDGTGHLEKDTKYFCLESDEFRRHFLAYYPEYAIITNVDIDHVDYFKDKADYRSAYEEFLTHVSKAAVVWGEDPETRKLNFGNIKHYWYGEKDNDDIQAVNVDERSDGMDFDVLFEGKKFAHFSLPLVGHHLLLNSLAVIGICMLEGIPADMIEKGLSSFHGVKRRFVVEHHGYSIYIDDYAHHPTEVGVTIDTARKRFPDYKLVAIFKPHRASRVKYFGDDFAKQLKKADKVYLCDFTSIDDKQDGTDIDITYLQKKIPGSVVISEDDKGADVLAKERPACFLFMSSKDIYFLADLVKKHH